MARHRKHRRRHHRRSSIRSLLSNPFSASGILSYPKEMIKKDFLMEAAGVGAGFLLPNIVMNYIPATFRDTKVKVYASKVVSVVALAAVSNLVSKKVSRMVLLGGGVSILLDIYADIRARMGSVVPAAAKGTSQWYGPGVGDAGQWYGPGVGETFEFVEEGLNDGGM